MAWDTFAGISIVDPAEWFFKAHFYQDPVCPGSLGVESFLQLLKYAAMQRWPQYRADPSLRDALRQPRVAISRPDPPLQSEKSSVDAVITHIEDGDRPLLMADGWLQVDNLYIYRMSQFGLRLRPHDLMRSRAYTG